MKFITINILMISGSLLYASDKCVTQVSYNDPHFATRTVHSVKKTECNCPCTAPRNDKNECSECGHHLIALPSFKTNRP